MNENKNRTEKYFWVLAVIVLVFGLFGMADRLSNGHYNANYGSYVPWGLWVAGYIYFMGISAGAFLMSSLVYVFKVKAFEKYGRLALLTALATLVAGLLSIWLDLGHMGRVWRMIFHTSFTSVMGWMSWLYSAYLILLLVEFWYAMRTDLVKISKENSLRGTICNLLTFGKNDLSDEAIDNDNKKLKILGILGIPLTIGFSGSVGAIFGAVGARPYWNSGLTPIIFLLGGLLSGSALLAFVVYNWGTDKGSSNHADAMKKLGQIILGVLAFDFLLEYAEITIGLWSSVPSDSASLKLILFGDYWWVFWFIHVGLGIVVPGILLTFGNYNPKKVAFAGFLIAATFITVRLNIIIPGLAIPEFEGLQRAFTGPGLTYDYFPSIMEWGVFCFTLAMGLLVFLLGNKFLPVAKVGKEATNE